MVRLVQRIIYEIEIDSLILKFSGAVSSSFHPRIIVKIIIYGYTSAVYSKLFGLLVNVPECFLNLQSGRRFKANKISTKSN